MLGTREKYLTSGYCYINEDLAYRKKYHLFSFLHEVFFWVFKYFFFTILGHTDHIHNIRGTHCCECSECSLSFMCASLFSWAFCMQNEHKAKTVLVELALLSSVGPQPLSENYIQAREECGEQEG